MKLVSLFWLMLAAIVVAAVPTLDLSFGKQQVIDVDGKKVEIAGPFTQDGYLVFGKKGIAIPANTLVSNVGTIIIDCRWQPMKAERGRARGFVTLRNKGRLLASLYSLNTAPRHAFFHCYDQDQQNFNPTLPFDVVDGTPYQMGFSYDGNTIRVFFNGKQVAEAPQKAQFDAPNYIYIGPYVDHIYDPPTWDDDCEIKRLRVYNEALSVQEVFETSGFEPEKLSESLPTVVNVPRRKAAITLDGAMTEDAWKHSASLPMLIDAIKPFRSWEYPENRFNLTWDEENLYLGTRTVFPRLAEIKMGAKRDEKETDVWGFESWEFYLKIKDKYYRFGGNVAGGYVEAITLANVGVDKSFNGKWAYKSTYKMRIDDRCVWESESAIPWKIFGLDAAPVKQDVAFNLGRSWFLADLSSYGSLTESGDYWARAEYPAMRLVDETATMQTLSINNPTTGKLEQEVLLAGNGEAELKVELANSLKLVPQKIVFEKKVALVAGEPQNVMISAALSGSGYDRILYTLTQNGQVVVRQCIPFFIAKNYLKIQPNILNSVVEYQFNKQMFAEDYPGVTPALQLCTPDGAVKSSCVPSAEGKVVFDRSYPKGNCTLELVNPKDSKTIYVCSFVNPGIGEWEKMVFDNRIIPPFTPQVTKKTATGAEISMWGRTYTWSNSLFPTSIISQDEELLSQPIALEINGKNLDNAIFTLLKQDEHRTEFSVVAANDICSAELKGWIEYDGVNYNTIKLQAKKNISSVKLRVQMPKKQVEFLHTSKEYFWGNKLTERVLGKYHKQIGFYPVVWMGEYEKGLCFFTETCLTWNNKERSVMTVAANDKDASLVVYPCTKLNAGESLELECGFLASPVKKLPANYPLNTFADHHQSHMNRPGRRPTSDIMLSLCGGYGTVLGDFFCDIPNQEKSVNGPWIKPSVEDIHKVGGRSVPYLLSRTLSEEYPEIAAYENVWRVTPGAPLDYTREGTKYIMPECCPTTQFSAFHAWKIYDYIKRIPTDGIYLDGSICGFCGNKLHGCNQRIPLLAQREFYRRVILVQLMAGIKDPVLVLHNTDSVQLPAFTFGTHLFNGEQIRQDSSTIMHNGKDILDTYDTTMFASELGSLPFGITNSVYQSNDILAPQYGGDPNEDPELYKFRITKPMLAGTLVHNTMPSQSRCHFGLFDRVVRVYDAFDVPNAKFIGYWKQPAQVNGGKDVFVSVYKHKDGGKCLAVVSHIGKSHDTQTLDIAFDLQKLGLKGIASVKEYMGSEDPEYAELYTLLKNTHIDGGVRHQLIRTPLKWGDAGVKLLGTKENHVKLELKFHSFALIEIAE